MAYSKLSFVHAPVSFREKLYILRHLHKLRPKFSTRT